MIHRAYYLCSSYALFHREILFLSGYFRNNGFPTHVIDTHVRRFLNKIHSPKPSPCSVPRDKFYFRLTFYNDSCHDRVRDLISTLERFYPQLHFLPSLTNPFTVGSFFKFKDALPNDLRSGVVYKFSCGGCDATYIGCTRQRFKARVCQHLGISDRTHSFLLRPVHSEPRNHASQCSTLLSADQFSIVDQCTNNLLTLESLYIKQLKPSLNSMQSSTPLLVAWRHSRQICHHWSVYIRRPPMPGSHSFLNLCPVNTGFYSVLLYSPDDGGWSTETLGP